MLDASRGTWSGEFPCVATEQEIIKSTILFLNSVALIVHIYLSISRADLAKKEYEAAKKWADDSLLIQMIEATIGLAVVRYTPPPRSTCFFVNFDFPLAASS